jgi:N-formylglutamate amidohydrolase
MNKGKNMFDAKSADSLAAMSEGAPPPFILKSATAAPGAFVFAAPHSGRHYPVGMIAASGIGAHALRMSEDAYVDHLFDSAPRHGASLLVATHARAYLDLNRGEDELDPDMFSPALDERTLDVSHRVKAGLGIIPKLVAEGLAIYNAPLPAREAFHRIDNVYRPYHQKLSDLLKARSQQFGYAVLIDCHSMPSEAQGARRRGRAVGPDIVLGDCWGASCARELTSLAEELLIRAGFSVRRNVPYSGGFSTQNYGAPNKGIHALQIEISRGLYMNEETLEPRVEFAEVKERLAWVTEMLIHDFARQIKNRRERDLPRAAE